MAHVFAAGGLHNERQGERAVYGSSRISDQSKGCIGVTAAKPDRTRS